MLVIVSGWSQRSLSSLHWPSLVARHGQDVAGAALGKVGLRLVVLGLHNDCALPAVHAALDGTGDADLELPLLAARETRKDGERESHWMSVSHYTDRIRVHTHTHTILSIL